LISNKDGELLAKALLLSDTNPENNTFIGDTVEVRWLGDGKDGNCDFLDLGILCWNSFRC